MLEMIQHVLIFSPSQDQYKHLVIHDWKLLDSFGFDMVASNHCNHRRRNSLHRLHRPELDARSILPFGISYCQSLCEYLTLPQWIISIYLVTLPSVSETDTSTGLGNVRVKFRHLQPHPPFSGLVRRAILDRRTMRLRLSRSHLA